MRDVSILWENAALSHLRKNALQRLVRNYSCRYGDIDLIMLDVSVRGSGSIAFVDEPYTNSGARSDGLAWVSPAKCVKLKRTAAVYLQAHPKLIGKPCRLNVVDCSDTPECPTFDWIRAAFDAC